MNRKWDERFMKQAIEVSKWSKDSTQVGCILVTNDKRVVSTGYNGLPRGCDDNKETFPERHIRPSEGGEKYEWAEHAERNAIYNAAFLGHSTRDTIAYVTTMLPCTDCARGLINAGIKRVVWQEPNDPETAKRWESKTKISEQMLLEAGVKLTSLQLYREPQKSDQ